MTKRILTYIAAFLAGLAIWITFGAIEARDPFLPWRFPVLVVFTGLSFPGGASPGMHYLNHIAETWFPFVVAFIIVRILTRSRARFSGALLMYGAFLIWSWGMVELDGFGVYLGTIFGIGFAGTLLGGLGLYLWLVDPNCSTES